ncbi:hypothetical protein P22_3675 [Propionispora sp. 2/2-37]|nr:hypothetical protein P22_3675 [Propionispora sp. 2/2-37]
MHDKLIVQGFDYYWNGAVNQLTKMRQQPIRQ